jgi:hypothetical protein
MYENGKKMEMKKIKRALKRGYRAAARPHIKI